MAPQCYLSVELILWRLGPGAFEKNKFSFEQWPLQHTMAEILNANPVIHSAAELPARKRPLAPPAKKNPLAFTNAVIPTAPTIEDLFSPPSSVGSISDEDEAEPIDEQEIYGMPFHDLMLLSLTKR